MFQRENAFASKVGAIPYFYKTAQKKGGHDR